MREPTMGLKETLLVLTVVLIWGLNFPMSKYGLLHIPPLLFITMRFAISFLVLVPFNRVPWRYLREIFILSIVFGLGHFGLLFYGLSLEIESSTASLLMQSGPVLAVVLGALVLKEEFSLLQSLGLFTSVMGTTMIIGLPEKAPSLLATSIVLSSAFLWAIATMIMRKLTNVGPLQLMCWLSAFVTPMFAVLWGLVEEFQIPSAPPLAYASVLFPSLCSTVFAYGIWNHLLQRVPVSQLSPFGLLVPLFGVTGGVMLLGETFEFWEIVGGVILLLGVTATSIVPAIKKHRKSKAALREQYA